jgi:hypothetical protein
VFNPMMCGLWLIDDLTFRMKEIVQKPMDANGIKVEGLKAVSGMCRYFLFRLKVQKE